MPGGRPIDALGLFHRVRAHLQGELGMDPGPDLRWVNDRILSADVSLLAQPLLGLPF